MLQYFAKLLQLLYVLCLFSVFYNHVCILIIAFVNLARNLLANVSLNGIFLS